jgi:hypothetical protein
MWKLTNRRGVAIAVAALALLLILAANVTHAASKKVSNQLEGAALEQFGENDGPAYLIVSMSSPVFETPYIERVNGSVMNGADEMGSTVALIKTGYVVAGFDLATTRFEGDSPITADLGGAFIDGHQATFIGGFRTFGDDVIHVMTPSPEEGPGANPIPSAVQVAYFNASRMFEEALAIGPGQPGGLSEFPTTVELACFIYEYGGVEVDVNEIMTSLFVGDMIMDCGSPCVAEGELFGHEPTESLLFFRGLFDDDNDSLKLDIGRRIGIDIKPHSSENPLNLGSEGVLPVAIFTERSGDRILFNAPAEIDVTTIRAVIYDRYGFELASVPVEKTSVQDVDGNGDADLLVHFRTQVLVGLIDFEQTVTIDFRANTLAQGMNLSGADDIRVVPKK